MKSKPENRDALWTTVILILTALSMAGGVFWMSLRSRSILHFRADDRSASAIKPLAQTRQAHCQISNQQYRPNDQAVFMEFAEQPEVVATFKKTGLAASVRCVDLTSSDREKGTSLILLLERIASEIVSQRKSGNQSAIVVTITVQATEPGANQPNPRDYRRLKQAIERIVNERSAIAIIGVTGKLQNELQTQLQDSPNVQICPASSVAACVEQAFTQARKL